MSTRFEPAVIEFLTAENVTTRGNTSDFHFFIEQDLEWYARSKRDDEVKAAASPFIESRSTESFANGMKKLAIIWKNRHVNS